MVVHASHSHALAISKELYQRCINGSSFYPSLRYRETLSIGSSALDRARVLITTFLYMELLLTTLLLLAIQRDVADRCFTYSSNSRVPAHRSGFVAQIIPVITHCIHIISSCTRYLRETMRFSATRCETSALDRAGV